jgi:DNA-binding phage protein
LADVISYGGDPRVIATRAEIDRIQSALAAAGNLLQDELEVTDFLTLPLKRIGLAMEMPMLQERINYLMQALETAANEYFDGEALVAKQLTDIGLVSAPLIAGGLLAVANDAGLLREHLNRVSVVQIDSFLRSAPKNLAELALRTRFNHQPAQISIDRYGQSFVVYIPGTQSWNPISGANPLDFTSNMQAMLGPGLAASEVGVQKALAKAGAGPNAKVVLVGHSQGGMIAANIAKQDKRVKALVTFGAPIGQVAADLKMPVVALEHTNDIVPKLGLKANPLAQNVVTVVREQPISKPIDALVEAHDISNYIKTAEMADESQEFGLKRVREQVLQIIGAEKSGEVREVTVYEMKRG